MKSTQHRGSNAENDRTRRGKNGNTISAAGVDGDAKEITSEEARTRRGIKAAEETINNEGKVKQTGK